MLWPLRSSRLRIDIFLRWLQEPNSTTMGVTMRKTLAFAAIAAGLFAAPALAAETLTVETSQGCSFDIKLREDLAPKHVAQITKLAKAGFYNGVVFHRVIDGFMAQTGDGQYGRVGRDISRAGTGGSTEPDIPAEFTREHYARGTVGMARTADPNSANSQFFIMFADGGFLDGQYTVWGQVDEAGMACVDQIKRGDEAQNGLVTDPDSMTKVTVK
jgi:peptidylprolyl isomerase